jgi:1,4-dihydroxy-2-naphthoate polyprenyltransferase
VNTFPGIMRPRSLWRTLTSVLRLGRPKFLLGGIVLYGLGALAARVNGFELDWASYLWGQLAVLLIQLMTHYSNDYYDYLADVANPNPTRWSGGSRVLVRGELPRVTALWMAALMALLAILAMIGLARSMDVRSWTPAILVLLIMQALAWSYSSPPLRLHTRGLGEPAVVIIVPFSTPLSGYVVQTGQLAMLPVLLCVPLAMLLTVMLLTLEFPDEDGDHAVGKRSWVVIFGAQRIARLCSVLIVLAFATTFAGVALGIPTAVSKAWLLLVPLGLFQLARMLAGDWRRPAAWSRLEFGSVALFFLAVVLDLVSLYRASLDESGAGGP